ncbi:DUF6265 family protein [Sphingomonas koreensis]
MIWKALGLMLVLPGVAPASNGLPEWLAGRWCTADGGPSRTCEQWQPAAGGMMLGTSQTVKGGKTVAFEFLRIGLDGDTAVYLPQPGGKAPVGFRAAAGGEGITFVNAAHDYPQRIHYRLSGNTLTAEISLADGSKAMRWTYRRMP